MKKKGKKKAKKGKKKDGGKDGFELALEERYRRTLLEIDSLKEDLVQRTEQSRKSRQAETTMKDKLDDAQGTISLEKSSKREISIDMTRQYKTMQMQLENKIETLEGMMKKLQGELEETKQKLADVTIERDILKKEKEEQLALLNDKLSTMEKSYESILQDTLDDMGTRMEGLRLKWDKESQLIEQKNRQVLLEFGVSHVDL
ncbi:dynein regulatory complex protein 12-like [Dysidea avara]|uniref:dynein regulatory complex protein 12-like n=1 Tax=Dysidea avara TaxID=196820 RepID=UPI00331A2DC2